MTTVTTGPPDASTAAARLEASGVTVRFGGLVALEGVDITVPAGAMVGLVGPNGAGKSTLFAVLSGLLRPDAGRVRMGGEDVTRASAAARARRGLARTFQRPELFSGLTVREHVVLADRVRRRGGRILRDLVTGGGFRRPSAAEDERVAAIIESLHLEELRDREVSGLSLGACRLVEVARALATGPDVLLLDEPASGLDGRETAELAATLTRVNAEHGVSLLLVEHDVELVLGMCETVNVLDFGTVLRTGPPEEIRSDPAVRAAYLGAEQPPGTARDAAPDTDPEEERR
ncbi:ABC transporter ATP-binding protein [Actinomadura sp. 7K534]|uniref:ABC transporter ATP-binding protein n=1 Tax=Actinomadura sp. 7K534 TaxID=2530366 RepID=UPI0010458A4A|nr:ABC transporter ATP-binding protein [Actinomadura sp. 7K534]TDB92908.1 ABC transporter ATP-binding protein [Actinomadura sp. 7K534]